MQNAETFQVPSNVHNSLQYRRDNLKKKGKGNQSIVRIISKEGS